MSTTEFVQMQWNSIPLPRHSPQKKHQTQAVGSDNYYFPQREDEFKAFAEKHVGLLNARVYKKGKSSSTIALSSLKNTSIYDQMDLLNIR